VIWEVQCSWTISSR